jgi:hypothetical protein
MRPPVPLTAIVWSGCAKALVHADEVAGIELGLGLVESDIGRVGDHGVISFSSTP